MKYLLELSSHAFVLPRRYSSSSKATAVKHTWHAFLVSFASPIALGARIL